MTNDDKGALPKWRMDLRESQNPYAAHYYDPDDREPARTAKELYRLSENPHAHDYYLGKEPQEASSASPSRLDAVTPAAEGISKADFEARCRSIFRRYMPEAEKTKLRPHHQDFIRKNTAASPQRRHALLQALGRYDLSSESGLRTYFNREEDAFTEEKLRAIEESVRQG